MEPFAQRARQLAETLQISIPIPSLPPSAYPASLNEQEVAILVSLAQGYMEQEIANNLMLSSQTVNHYMNSLFNKIGVTSRTAAVDYALERGLFSPILLQHRLGRPAKLVPYSQEGQVSPPVVSPPRERALVVILVTDMQDSTAVIQHFGDAKAQELLRIHNTIIRACLHEYGGSEITHTGDGIEASFPSASLAVECAVAIQRAFAKHNQEHPDTPLRVRIGLNAGEPIPMEGRLFGIAIHVTFRICACAQPGQILVSDVIRQLTAGKGFSFISCGDVALKGFSEHFRLYEVPWKNT
jgi:class 3 adenylate cyclase/DNA-binding CsgD family transcriptional regulator